MNFSRFNKERLFAVNTAGFDYVNLEDLYTRNKADKIYKVCGLYIGTKSQFDPEVPIVALNDTYVNLPVHQLSEVQSMLSSPQAIQGIRNGECGFTIQHYYQQRYKKDCYKAVWCNYIPDDTEDDAMTDDE